MTRSRKRRGRGEGGVRYDEGRKLWVASVSLGFHPDGRRNRPVAYGKTKAECLAALDELKREAAVTPPPTLTVDEMLSLWLADRKSRTAVGTQELRERAAANVRRLIGAEPVATLRPLRVTRFYRDMEAEGLAPSPRWHAARALRAADHASHASATLAQDRRTHSRGPSPSKPDSACQWPRGVVWRVQ